jgi:aspartate kinase
MIVNKFGGASIKNSEAIKQMFKICNNNIKTGIIVVSAMGKTTNLLEQIILSYFKKEPIADLFNKFISYHTYIINELFATQNNIKIKFNNIINLLSIRLNKTVSADYDFEYDSIVPFGELVSSLIISEYLNTGGLTNTLIDITKVLKTDANYRDAKVNIELSSKNAKSIFNDTNNKLYITQGFIGSAGNNYFTTLGREGSDFTAAILANMLNAQKVVVWKDVPGIMCADPQWLPDAPKIEQLSYLDAVELAFYGAKVIHPKTIKPLQNKNIPLQVRSFVNTKDKGTLIKNFNNLSLSPVYIKKDNQVLISIKPFDYSFIIEENLSHIFGILAKNKIKVNLMQNSAISFTIVVDNDLYRVKNVIKELKKHYNAKYNDNLQLITIRHFKQGAEDIVLKNKLVLLEEHTRSVARFLVKD